MTTAVYESDVVELAAALLGIGTSDETAAYRPGQPLFDLLQSGEEFDEVTIDISGQTSNLRETLAALDAVQLAIDAAGAAVEYRYRTRTEDADDDPDLVRARLTELDLTWDLEVIELSSPGSFRAKLKAVVTSPTARKKALAVAGLTATVTAAIFTPVGVFAIPGIVISALGTVNEFLPSGPPPGVVELAEQLKQQQLESLEREAALRAKIQELKIMVEKKTQNGRE